MWEYTCITRENFELVKDTGIVTNIANFGAFVDVGVHKDGLVHISEMSHRRINNPSEVVALHQHVMVKVIDIDKQRGRIQLSLKV